MAAIEVTVDDALANDAMRVLDEIGMNMETAVSVFCGEGRFSGASEKNGISCIRFKP